MNTNSSNNNNNNNGNNTTTTTVNRQQNSVNIFHVLNLLKFGGLDKFDSLVSMFFITRDPDIRKKLLYRLCFNKVNFKRNNNSIDVIAAIFPKIESLDKEEKEAAVLSKVQKDIFYHLTYYFKDNVGDEGIMFRNSNKVYLLAYCTARLQEQMVGIGKGCDRDNWSNKRIEASSKDMEYLFKNAYEHKLTAIHKIDRDIDHKCMKKIAETMENQTITESFVKSFKTQKWAVKNRPTMKTTSAQNFVQESQVYVMSLLDQVQVSMSRTDKQTNARMVQDSQFGFIDPVYCTEGRNTGLVKSISCTVQVSPWKWRNDFKIISHLLDEGLCSYHTNSSMAQKDYIFVNAVCLGWCNGDQVVEELQSMKLRGEIPKMTSVSKSGRMVSVHTTPFRLMRPLFVVDKETCKPIYETKNLRTKDPDELIKAGAIEYLDPMEQECARIAPNINELRKMGRL